MLSLTMTFLFLLLSLSSPITCKSSHLLDKPQCTTANQRKIELIIAKAQVFGPHGRKLPENMAQLKTFCRDTNRMVAQIESFVNNCYEKTVKDYTKIVLYTIKSQLRKYCGKSGSKLVREFIKLAPCANKYVQPFDGCIVEFINKTSRLVNIADDRLKFPHVCCFFVEGTKCGEEYLNRFPCMRPHVPAIMDLFRSGTQSIIDLGCGEYTDQTDACSKLGPPPKPVKPNRTKYLTIAFVLVDLLASVKDPTLTPGLGA